MKPLDLSLSKGKLWFDRVTTNGLFTLFNAAVQPVWGRWERV